MKTLYRIEHRKNKMGPFRPNSVSYALAVALNKVHNYPPMDVEFAHIKDLHEFKCAFNSKELFDQYFKQFERELIKCGMVIYEIEVTEAYQGDVQSIFLEKNIIKKKRLKKWIT